MKKIKNKFSVAFEGLCALLLDFSVQIQLLFFILVSVLAFLVKMNLQDYAIIVLVSMIVIVCEMINTCIEKLCDRVQPSYDEQIKKIKDMSAGVVLFACFGAVIVGCCIMMKYI